MIFESRTRVKRFEEEKYKELAYRYYDILNKIVGQPSTGIEIEQLEKPMLSIAKDSHGVIYYCRFLVDVTEHPSEEIILLLDARDKRDHRLENELRNGIKGKGKFSWLSKVNSEIITENAQLDDLSRQSGRAYFAYILADEYLWRLIEGVKKPMRKAIGQSEGVDIVNPALSVEEILILNKTKYASDRVVLPLFDNGRAGSGKSTMLYHLFAEYVMRRLKSKLPGRLLFLTYTKRLLEESKKTVENLLKVGTEFIGESLNDNELIGILNEAFWVFPEFLMHLIPQEERFRKFPAEKFITNFGDFSRAYDKITPKTAKLYSPDMAWHVIRTYIKGYNPTNELTPDDYRELPKKERNVPIEMYNWVWENVWPRYKENYWDTQDIVRYLIVKDAVPPEYSVIFCDEAQDFTRVELHFLWRLLIYREYDLRKQGKNLRIPLVFAGDPFQTINPTGFRWEALESGFYTEISEALDPEGLGLVEFRHEDLSFNYRSTAPIVRFGNLLQMWRKWFFKVSDQILQKPLA